MGLDKERVKKNYGLLFSVAASDLLDLIAERECRTRGAQIEMLIRQEAERRGMRVPSDG